MNREQLLERESRWARVAGITAILSAVLLIAGTAIGSSTVGDGQAESLVLANEDQASVTLSSLVQALGFCLWIPILVWLFLAVSGRAERVKTNLVGAAVVSPIFLGASYVVGGIVTLDAAEDFVGRMVTGSEERMNDIAQEAFDQSTLQELTLGLGFGGRIGLAFVLIYTGLWAMRTGLLSRFWGSLGMAVGGLLFFTPVLAIIWFVYMGLLALGFVPGGRPPAWAAGRAIPWPTPGEKMAEELEGEGGVRPVPAEEPEEGKDRWGASYDSDDDAEPANPPRLRGERRKRKRRD